MRDLEQAARINPGYDYVQGDLLHMKMLGGDWKGFAAERALIDEAVRVGNRAIRPFAYQPLSPSPEDLQKCAMIFTADAYPAQPPLWRDQARGHGKIRIGYVCGAFSSHAFERYLAAGLYEQHDRKAFEIIAPDAGRERQQRHPGAAGIGFRQIHFHRGTG